MANHFWQQCIQNMIYSFGLDEVTASFDTPRTRTGVGKKLNAMASVENVGVTPICIEARSNTASKAQTAGLMAAWKSLPAESRLDIEQWHSCSGDMVPPSSRELGMSAARYGDYIRSRWSAAPLFTNSDDAAVPQPMSSATTAVASTSASASTSDDDQNDDDFVQAAPWKKQKTDSTMQPFSFLQLDPAESAALQPIATDQPTIPPTTAPTTQSNTQPNAEEVEVRLKVAEAHLLEMHKRALKAEELVNTLQQRVVADGLSQQPIHDATLAVLDYVIDRLPEGMRVPFVVLALTGLVVYKYCSPGQQANPRHHASPSPQARRSSRTSRSPERLEAGSIP
eukprot:7381062-Prymnesium_polylepis.1